ncbi:MAG: (Fe-S)-binding protein [Rhodothermales bacterium]
MNVALFVPCYIDQFYPGVAIATLGLLERLGCTVAVPENQTCCGQPLANAGFEAQSLPIMEGFADTFGRFDYIVSPSGSCVLHVKEHFGGLGDAAMVQRLHDRTYELCQFLVDVLRVDRLDARFPHRVGIHESCHGLRGLRLGKSSERNEPAYSKPRQLLEMVEGIELVDLDRSDECCGFGGTFAVNEEALSVKMGRDRLNDHARHGVEVITGTDMSCLMHLQGLGRRERRPVRFLHVAEILAGQVAGSRVQVPGP